MYEPLIEHLRSAKEQALHEIDLEEIALIQALRNSYSPTSPEAVELAFVPGLLNGWLQLDFEELTHAFAMRMQPLLRNVLDTLITKGVGALNPSQTQYLIAVGEILPKIRGADKNNRLLKLFEQHAHELRTKIIGNDASGLPDLKGILRFTTAREIEKASRNNTKTFGGIDLHLVGPMFKHEGDLKVLDSVPEDSMVAVEGGSCYVSGYVMGHVFVSDRCEVRDNISGTVIAEKGNVQARNILMKAYVVSKWADIIAEDVRNPELLFAGEKIHIHGRAELGNYVAPIIQIDGEVSGGEFTFSETCDAPKFSLPETRNLILEMQDKISCDVYGGLIDPEAGRIVASLNKLKMRHEHVTKMIKAIHTECEHVANNGIMYLLGGELVQTQIEEISRKQRRLAFLERIINGIDGLAQSARMRLIQQKRRRAQRAEVAQEGGIKELSDDLAQIKSAPELDSDLATEGRELHALTKSMSGREPIAIADLNKLDGKKLKWVSEKAAVLREVTELESLIRNSTEGSDAAGKSSAGISKVDLLNQIIEKTKGRSNQDAVLRRSRTNFIQILLRTIDQRRHRMLNHSKTLKRLSNEYAQLTDRLKSKFNLDPPSDDDEKSSPIARGIFDTNVIICTDKFLIDTPETANDGLHFTTESKAPRAYTIKQNKIAQVS